MNGPRRPQALPMVGALAAWTRLRRGRPAEPKAEARRS